MGRGLSVLYILITKWSPDTAPLALKAMTLFTPSCLPAEQSEGFRGRCSMRPAFACLGYKWSSPNDDCGYSAHKEGCDDIHTFMCKIRSLIVHLTPLSISYILRLFYTFIVEADLCSDSFKTSKAECLLQCISPMVQQM